MDRQIGTTTEQMRNAPKGAIFLWCNENLNYPLALAMKIGRDDLEIKGKHILASNFFRGRRISGLIIDHAANLTDSEYKGLSIAFASILANKATPADAKSRG